MESLQIRPNRLEVSDRFPMLGFSVRASTPVSAEIALARDPSLFDKNNLKQRTAANFFSTHADGQLVFDGANKVYMVPPDALANFVGAKQLYFAVAASPLNGGGTWEVQVPSQASPYISLKGFTGRTVRRSPGAGRFAGKGYGTKGLVLEWVGDSVAPSGAASNGTPANDLAPNGQRATAGSTSPQADIDYQDGFGVLGDVSSETAPAPRTTPAPTAAGQGLAARQGRAQDATDWFRGALGKVATDLPTFHVYPIANAFDDPQFAEMYGALPAPLRNTIESARQQSYALAVGPQVNLAAASAGAGVVFDSGGDVGLYVFGDAGDAGIDVSDPLGSALQLMGKLRADVTLSVMVMKGKIAALETVRKALGASVGIEVVGGLYALLTSELDLVGFAAGLGVGVELDVGGYFSRVRRFLSAAVQSGLVRAQAAPTRARPAQMRRRGAVQQGVLDALFTEVPPIYLKPLGNLADVQLISDALDALPAGVKSALDSARNLGLTLGVGREVVVGPAAAGGGVAVDTSGDVALYYYGDHGIDLEDPVGTAVSILSSLSANVTGQYLVVKGGLSALTKIRKAIGGMLGEEVVAGAHALFDGDESFLGVSAQVGVGVAFDVGAFIDKVKGLLPAPIRSALGLSVALDFMGDLQQLALDLMEKYDAPTVSPVSVGLGLVVRGLASVVSGPLAPVVTMMPTVAQTEHLTLAFGFSGGTEILDGRVGCIFGRDGRAGVYYFGKAALGWSDILGLLKNIVSQASVRADLTQQLTVLDGEIEDLGRLAYHAGLKESATVEGVPVVFGLDALFDGSRSLKGATLDIGVGLVLQIRKVAQLRGLLPLLRKLPSPHAEAAALRVSRGQEIATDDLAARADAVDPSYGASLRELLEEQAVSPEQAAEIVAFLEPESSEAEAASNFEPGAAPIGEAASLRARATALARRGPSLRKSILSLGVREQRGKVSWDLEGFPEVRVPVRSGGLKTVETILDNWPASPDGTALPLRVAWQFDPQTGAAGGVVVEPREPREGNATSLEVKSAVGPLREEGGLIAVPLTVKYTFSRVGEPAEVATTELILRGDGTFDRTNTPPARAGFAGQSMAAGFRR